MKNGPKQTVAMVEEVPKHAPEQGSSRRDTGSEGNGSGLDERLSKANGFNGGNNKRLRNDNHIGFNTLPIYQFSEAKGATSRPAFFFRATHSKQPIQNIIFSTSPIDSKTSPLTTLNPHHNTTSLPKPRHIETICNVLITKKKGK